VQDVPSDYYDAAAVDGAGPLRTFVHVTWPLIRPTSFFVFILLLVTGLAGMQTFDLVYVMTGGGPAGSTRLASFYIYEQAFRFNQIGYASALACVLAVLLILISASLFAITRGGRFDA
jgi:multiple sugar transport system permease protein